MAALDPSDPTTVPFHFLILGYTNRHPGSVRRSRWLPSTKTSTGGSQEKKVLVDDLRSFFGAHCYLCEGHPGNLYVRKCVCVCV